MNLFKLRQYIRYRLKAQGRHGLHSPFAYAFVEDVLRNYGSKADFLPYLAQYYSIKNFVQYANGELVYKSVASTKKIAKRSALSFERLVFFPSVEGVNDHLASADVGDVLLVEGIHNDENSLTAWQHLCAHPRVTMSIDVFDCGLLFFREEFKVKQDFVLR